jgi:hypothetical protein
MKDVERKYAAVDRLDRVPIWKRLPPRPLSAHTLACILPTDTARDVYIACDEAGEYHPARARISTFVVHGGTGEVDTLTLISRERETGDWTRVTTVESKGLAEYDSVEHEIYKRFYQGEPVDVIHVATYTGDVQKYVKEYVGGQPTDYERIPKPSMSRLVVAYYADRSGLSDYDDRVARRVRYALDDPYDVINPDTHGDDVRALVEGDMLDENPDDGRVTTYVDEDEDDFSPYDDTHASTPSDMLDDAGRNDEDAGRDDPTPEQQLGQASDLTTDLTTVDVGGIPVVTTGNSSVNVEVENELDDRLDLSDAELRELAEKIGKRARRRRDS